LVATAAKSFAASYPRAGQHKCAAEKIWLENVQKIIIGFILIPIDYRKPHLYCSTTDAPPVREISLRVGYPER
jgi:hypothetical protein